MDLNHLSTFHVVAQQGTLAAAARVLGVPTSTVSRHISRLEAALGVDLILRTPRGIVVTDAGAELLERSAGPLDDLGAVMAALPSGRPRGTLRLTLPSNLANLPWFTELLLDFRLAHPEVRLDVALSVRDLDRLDESFDVGFRPASLVGNSADLVARSLPAIEVRLVASSRYLAHRGRPRRIEDLHEHDFVAARHLVGHPFVLRRGSEQATVSLEPAMVGDDLSFVLPMVAAGGGFAPIPTPYLQGRAEPFEPLLPDWSLAPLRPTLVWQRRRFTVPRVRAFVDHVVRYYERRMDEPS